MGLVASPSKQNLANKLKMPIADKPQYCDFNPQTMMEVSLYIKCPISD